MAMIGKLKEIQKELDVEWSISNFDSLSDEADKYYASPSFSFNGSSWYLKIYPNGRTADKSVGYIGMCLIRLSSGPANIVDFNLGIKTLEGKRDRERFYTCICDSFGSRYVPKCFISQYGTPWGISRSQLFERKSELMPSNALTMLCTLKNPKNIEDSNYIATAECIHCHKLFDALRISSHEKICLSKPIKCPECTNVVMLQNWHDHECGTAKTEAERATSEFTSRRLKMNLETVFPQKKEYKDKLVEHPKSDDGVPLQNCCKNEYKIVKEEVKSHVHETSASLSKNKFLQNFKDLFLNKEDCDVIIRVKQQEFQAHKVILKARSEVLATALRNNTKVQNTGCLDIEDCEPSVFYDFLCFLYSEDENRISAKTAIDLFSIAEKYNVSELKEKCIEFMKENLSIETFCDTIAMALRHSQTDLIDISTEFFVKNAPRIIQTDKWQSLLTDNPTQSNMLFMRLLASDKSSNVSVFD